MKMETKQKTRVRLTPKQLRLLTSVSNWGHCFTIYSEYGFLADKDLVRRATAAEIEAHYQGLRAELQDTSREVHAALESEQWEQVKDHADHANCLNHEIAGRAEEAPFLVVLTDAARGMIIANVPRVNPCAEGHDFSYAVFPAGRCRRCGVHD